METKSQNTKRETALPERELSDAARNWLAMDGLWFQAVEAAYGMEAALAADRQVWEQFSVIEARRIMGLLGLPERGGLDALERALAHRMYAHLNNQEIRRIGPSTLILTMKTCRVQEARKRKQMPAFPCRSVGIIEYTVFARTIDDRIVTECRSCPPETHPEIPFCSWKFTLPTV